MRPAKVVLCAGSEEDRLYRRVFLLRTWGYCVLSATSAEEALAILAFPYVSGHGLTRDVDLLLVDLPLMGIDAGLFREARRLHPRLRTLITSNHSAYYDPYGADGFLVNGSDSPAELIERVRILVARKRGPMAKVLRTVLDASRERPKKTVVSAQLSVVSKGEEVA